MAQFQQLSVQQLTVLQVTPVFDVRQNEESPGAEGEWLFVDEEAEAQLMPLGAEKGHQTPCPRSHSSAHVKLTCDQREGALPNRILTYNESRGAPCASSS